MLKLLLTEIFNYYLKPNKVATTLVYFSYIFAILGFIILITTSFSYFFLCQKAIFCLIITASSCFTISMVTYIVNYYIKRRNKHKILRFFLALDKFLLTTVLKKISVIIKNKFLYSYKSVIIWCILSIVLFSTYKNLKSRTSISKSN